MRGIHIRAFVLAAVLTAAFSVPAPGAFQESVEQAYNTAVLAQDALDGLDVAVFERTTSAETNIASAKEVDLKVSGIKETSLLADISVTTEEGEARSYYRGGYYYEEAGEDQIRTAMDRETIWDRINSHIYLDMTSNYLKLLYLDEGDASTDNRVYIFAATDESLGDYKVKLLDAYAKEHGAVIDSLQGRMEVDAQGHVVYRQISMVYTVGSGEERGETFHKIVEDTFRQDGEVTVTLPDLKAYEKNDPQTPAVTITPLERTAYVTADVNVRAAGSLEAAIIGGYARGSGIAQTGLTSDGWVQIQYNGASGYIWGDFVSAVKPVYVTDSSGVMYALADVNIREDHNADSRILGVLRKGQSVTVTGLADNGWVRVDYLGGRAYVAGNYLSRSEPVDPNYVKNASVSGSVVDASYGTLVLSTAGGTMMFNTQYAAFDLADGLDTGDWVSVVYSGAGSPYTASSVRDTQDHTAGAGVTSLHSIDGVVSACEGNTLTLSCSDGTVRTFDLRGASVEVPGGLSAGDYVLVSWMSANGNEKNNIAAIAVS